MWARLLPVLCLVPACAPVPRPLEGLADRTVQLAGTGTRSLGELLGATATLLVSLDPECPVTQLYAPVLDSLARALPAQGVQVVGFHPSPFTDAGAVGAFMEAVLPGLPHVVDTDCGLGRALQCRVMPEVFLIDARGRLRYRGAIDDRVVRAGRKKPQAARHHLNDALRAVLAGGRVPRAYVPAMGCIVECDTEWDDARP
ncbi:MAG: redoxin domain-containing protein [Flavobacteriales bacterium]|jgi:hypothetical protein|nr:redoxin domain-containing protein [Flavobacteriales bacterium]